jgi:two-component system NtrC family sensor kinase
MADSSNIGRVLVVDDDPDVLDLLERQVLEPLGYDVAIASDASTAIQQSITFMPDLIIASMTLPGLSGKDLLVALRSQGIKLPTLVMAEEGMESDAIAAFRLGANDYLKKPLREAEVVTAVERAINETRLRGERQRLAQQLADSNRQLEHRVRELTTLFGIGKTVTSTTHQGQLFDKLMEGSLFVTDADMGYVLLEDESSGQLVLRAEAGMPSSIVSKLHQSWDDGVSGLVMLSGETFSINGEGLSQFKIEKIAKALLIAPVKVRDKQIGVLVVAREEDRAFNERDQAMLEAVADYASISLVNARLFQALEARATHLQRVMGEANMDAQARAEWRAGLERGLRAARAQIGAILERVEKGDLQKAMQTVDADLLAIIKLVNEAPETFPGKIKADNEASTDE